MTLSEIIKADAEYMKDVIVHVNVGFGTVLIIDNKQVQENIFLQEHEADEFIKEMDKLYDEAGDVWLCDVAKHLAKPYLDNSWN